MKIKFYGTRGSIPTCGQEFQEFGGNTTCLQITFVDSNRIAILDAGTGIRNLGKDFIASGREQDIIRIGFTHFHWDHIQGLPFFGPAFNPEQRIMIMATGKGRGVKSLKDLFNTTMQKEYFPLSLDNIGAKVEFSQEKISSYELRGNKVTAIRHNHPGGAFSYRVERNGRTFVFCTDIEHADGIDPNIVALSKGADLLVHDGQFTSEELQKRKGWGHSSYEQAIEVAERAGVKRLIITHHDPDHDDEFLKKMEKKCQDRFRDCLLAREGMEVDV